MANRRAEATLRDAGDYVLEWFDIEEETYASKTKFGYERNLEYVRQGGLEEGSVWYDSQLTSYWDRAVRMDAMLRADGASTIAARQQFAKHANAVRALFSTLEARTTDGDYIIGKGMARRLLTDAAFRYTPANVPFTDSSTFNPNDYWHDELKPELEAARLAIRGNLPESISWDEVVRSTNEVERHRATMKPLAKLMLGSFAVVACYVFSDGPLPKPGLPSGEIRPWQ